MKRGDIVILDVPFPDRTGTKVRPGLVVQSDRYNGLNNTVIVAITSSANRMVGAKTQLFIDIATPEGRATGLRTHSVIQCNHLLTIDQSLIHRTIGKLSAAQMLQINDCLKEGLGIL
jgi:mRNA-degrading endonuclease toxin of MazEF toxin-antitoxin module